MTKKDGKPVRPGKTPKAPEPGKLHGNAGRKPAEDALENSLSLLKATVESTADGILVVDKNGRIETFNQKFLEMWRIPASLAKSGDDSLLLDFVLGQLKEPRKFLDKVNQLYSRPSAESFDVLEFKDGRTIERYSLPQKIKNRIVGRVWNFRNVTDRKRTEKVNAAVYKISEITNNTENLEELFASIHSIISELMPARNFYIALYDPETGLLSFPYHKDEYDEAPPPQPLRRGLTDYVLRQGEPLLADPVKFLELERSGEVESIGAPSIDWLGVPLKVKDKTIGVMVVQTYTEGVRYKEEDRDMLMFVSNQAAVAIERKRAEATLRASLREKEVLLREIHHRVKNNMQVISSLFNLQAGHTTNEECRGILKEGQMRIRSMSLVHEKLYQSRDLSKIGFADYIQSLVVHLFHSYLVKPDQVRFETDFEDVSLDINSAVPCGLILNELISNALKHAFPEGRTGVIKIGLRRGPGGAVELRVADDGVGFPKRLDFRKAESFGLQIVNLLVDQLEATIEIDRTKGTAFTVTFRELKYALRT